MIEKIISGGQTGGDRGGWKAAIAVGIPIGGWVTKGRKAEDGEVPEVYPVKETPSEEYPQRTEWNVRDSNATIIFKYGYSAGCALTERMIRKYKKSGCIIDFKEAGMDDRKAAGIISKFLRLMKPKVVNIAGSRESKAPGIEARVEHILLLAFASLGDDSSSREGNLV